MPMMAINRMAHLMSQHKSEFIFAIELFQQADGDDDRAIWRAKRREFRRRQHPHIGIERGGQHHARQNLRQHATHIIMQRRRGHEPVGACAQDTERACAPLHDVTVIRGRLQLVDRAPA